MNERFRRTRASEEGRPVGAAVVRILIVSLLLCPGVAEAQTEEPAVRVALTAGWLAPVGQAGRFAEDDRTVDLEITDTWAIGGEVRFGLFGGDRFRGRVHVFLGPGSELNEVRVTGFESCGEDCFRPVEEETLLADARAAGVAANVMVRILRGRSVEPYAWLGLGLRHYSFDGEAAPANATDPVVDFGGGIESEIAGIRWFVEGGGLVGRTDLEPSGGGPDPDPEGGLVFHARLGASVFRF